jgi:PPP family 3-phenylpropionic acid transporter
MFCKNGHEKYPIVFVCFYAVLYMSHSILNTFFPIYFKHVGYDGSSLGMLLSVGPLVAILAQPFWGTTADRAKSKVTVLRVVCAASSATVFLLLASSDFYLLILSLAVFSFSYYSMFALCDTITLEYLKKTNWNFGPIRLAGTLGFAVMAAVAGKLATKSISSIFVLLSLSVALSFLLTYRIPVVKGYQHGRPKTSIFKLFKHKEFVFMSVFFLAVMCSMGFYYSFFPVYYEQLGASRSFIGISVFIAGCSEAPFLLFSSRLSNRFHPKYILLGSAITVSIRWLALHLVSSLYVLLPLMALHGLSYIVLSYAMATYVNNNVPAELRASGQAVNWLISMGLSRIIGSILGGLLVDRYGIRQVFMLNSVLVALFVVLFGLMLIFQNKRRLDPG